MIDEVCLESEASMEKAIEHAQHEFSRLRSGKATTALVDGIRVEAYGSLMPLSQMATVTVPEPRLIVVQPWDKSTIKDIEKAIMKSDLGLNPSNDGSVIRLAIPQLTEERRKDLVRMVKKLAEDGRVSVRSIRRDANERLKSMVKKGEISEDQMHDGLEEIQKLTNRYVKKIDELTAKKEAELMEV